MRVHILGSAAGGGVPQWNCGCLNCCEARREGGTVTARTQSCAAITGDGSAWYLLNASPDAPAQLAAFAALRPNDGAARHNPVAGVLLTNADLDHVLGIALLREGEAMPVWATAEVRRAMESGWNATGLLAAYGGIHWSIAVPGAAEFELCGGLRARCVALTGKPPRYRESQEKSVTGNCVAWLFTDIQTGRRLLVAPDVACLDPQLQDAAETADAVLLDGTFWSDGELREVDPAGRTARDMGHWPVGGPSGSLEWLRSHRAPRRGYLHINNTNPMLRCDSEQAAEVRLHGITIAEDGMEWTI
ncbi:MAG: pyrroloquinoline quinone biosynthesis protein PqqB [Armatimonadetes bacterium]|nr:pyrroloquinoline quinone biosynthesis protein PqqB [Armatimonadota bacterium]MDE2206615.1 pyrroloquinoline quinone biosynthesis protein PqqB [Armatimonadota bacterium]